jgi:hypothetical protein
MIGFDKRYNRVDRDGGPGFGCLLAVNLHVSGEDQGPRALARRCEAALDQERVEPLLLFLQLVRWITQPTMAVS